MVSIPEFSTRLRESMVRFPHCGSFLLKMKFDGMLNSKIVELKREQSGKDSSTSRRHDVAEAECRHY